MNNGISIFVYFHLKQIISLREFRMIKLNMMIISSKSKIKQKISQKKFMANI